jgi:hypothetical protein
MLKLKDMKEIYDELNEEEKHEIKQSFVDGVKEGCFCVGAGVVAKGIVKMITGSDLISDVVYLATTGTLLAKYIKKDIDEVNE